MERRQLARPKSRRARDPARATLAVRPLRRTTLNGYVLTRREPLVVELVDGLATLTLPPTVWKIVESVQGLPPVRRVVRVPDVETLAYVDLVDVDPLESA